MHRLRENCKMALVSQPYLLFCFSFLVCTESFGMALGSTPSAGIVVSASSGSASRSNVMLNSGTAWCATIQDQNQYLQVNFRKRKTINGIAIQGDPTSNKWTKSFQLKYGDSCSSLQTYSPGGTAKVSNICYRLSSVCIICIIKSDVI